MTASTIPFRRPGQEPPSAPPPSAPAPTGSVCLSPDERAALSEIHAAAQHLARINAGPSVPAALVARMDDTIGSIRESLDRLQIARDEANRRGRS